MRSPPSVWIGVTEKPGAARRDQDDRDALVLRGVGIGARREPDVVGVLRVRREDLLAVDDVVVAVADGARLERGEVGAGAGLGVADAEESSPCRMPRQQRLLLRLGAELHDRRADRVDAMTGSGARAR